MTVKSASTAHCVKSDMAIVRYILEKDPSSAELPAAAVEVLCLALGGSCTV